MQGQFREFSPLKLELFELLERMNERLKRAFLPGAREALSAPLGTL